jgi:hypothetical protein
MFSVQMGPAPNHEKSATFTPSNGIFVPLIALLDSPSLYLASPRLDYACRVQAL